ncbi:uncharacterized protein EV420DRAFT_1560326 [Desarmillaria tabescens]|uniref:HNH nuclease domain-containing protein n=1 Tax=Armillaria tabescens TaxID=1929756 RepID=A0AA39MYX5_ARMTA|nr:uncharacterized protein EV420DRAFT_1560326 [Desarmillaria tabescens]KAK0451323.1 hypothetical protein EV420DRAFT_1560326 [Desarmillaria tabescens]
MLMSEISSRNDSNLKDMLHPPQPSDFTPRPLPANPFLQAGFYAAFNLCLSLESRSHLVSLPDPRHPPVILCARILGYALIEAPTNVGRDHMAKSINDGSTDDTLLALGKYYAQRLLRIFEREERTLSPSDHPSCPDIDNAKELCQYIMEQASLNHSTAKKAALLRDGYHCLLRADTYDRKYFDRNPSAILSQNPNCNTFPLQCVHIFPKGLNSNSGENDDSPSDKHDWVASVWAAVFGLHMTELNGVGTHRLQNILTLCPDLHDGFDQLALWLRAVANQPNTYVIETVSVGVLRSLPNRVVTFTTPDPQALPLPSPDYLAIHAACCRIAHMSGAIDYVDDVLQDEEEICERIERMGILAEDGSSMDLFDKYMTAAIRI